MGRDALIQWLRELRQTLDDRSENAYEGRNLWDHQQVFRNWHSCMDQLEEGQAAIDSLLYDLQEDDIKWSESL